jgi:hypothetical protein
MSKFSLVGGAVCMLALCLLSSADFAQQSPQNGTGKNMQKKTDTAAVNKETIRTAASLKSGTSQDVLTSFFKLAYSDVSNGHNFGFSSSLFAVRAKTDTSLWIDTNYRKQVFARNFVFGFNYALDSNFKYKSASLNLKYAIINNRDKNLFQFGPGILLGQFMKRGARLGGKAANIYIMKHPELTRKQRDSIFYYYAFHDLKDKTPKNKMPKEFLHLLDSLQATPEFQDIRDLDMANFRDSLKNIYKVVSGLLAKRDLWTVETRLYTDRNNVVSKANFNTEYLKGITNNHSSMGAEIDIRANWNIYDSTVVKTVHHRNVFSASAGINWIIYKNRLTQKSYVEFNPALTYINVFSGQYSGENKSKLTGKGVLRFRITDDLWLPIGIKYDPDKGKVLGFLNITSNFDWLGSKKKS